MRTACLVRAAGCGCSHLHVVFLRSLARQRAVVVIPGRLLTYASVCHANDALTATLVMHTMCMLALLTRGGMCGHAAVRVVRLVSPPHGRDGASTWPHRLFGSPRRLEVAAHGSRCMRGRRLDVLESPLPVYGGAGRGGSCGDSGREHVRTRKRNRAVQRGLCMANALTDVRASLPQVHPGSC